MDGSELDKGSSIKELREKTIEYYRENLQGTSVRNKILENIDIDKNGIVHFTASGRNEMKNSSAKANKLLMVKYLPNLIQNAVNITHKQSTKLTHRKEHFYYLHARAIINDESIPVEITLIKRNNGDIQYYNHTLPAEEYDKAKFC